MKTANLTGAHLDYWTARAEGVPVADLELRANGTLCVRNIRGAPGKIVAVQVLDYSTNWALTGPLRDKYRIWLEESNYRDRGDVYAYLQGGEFTGEYGPDALIAICRAVVRAAFGDEVEDLP